MFTGAPKRSAPSRILKLPATPTGCPSRSSGHLPYLKKAAALTNLEAGVLPKEKCDLIARVCDEILAGTLDDQFPLVVWQTGSGTQSNMNANEVIAYRAHVLNGGQLTDEQKFVHPNDDVNKSQSSNDTFPTAMHIAAYKMLVEVTIPGIEKLRDTLKAKSEAFMDVVKIGRTHFMDATPLDAGAGIFGLCRPTRPRPARHPQYPGAPERTGARRHGRRHGHQHAERATPKMWPAISPTDGPAFRDGAQQI
jgi:fumarate hydratase class II